MRYQSRRPTIILETILYRAIISKFHISQLKKNLWNILRMRFFGLEVMNIVKEFLEEKK